MALNRPFPSRALGSFTGPYVPFGLWTVPRHDFISVICEAQHEVSSLKLNAHLGARLPVRSQANQSAMGSIFPASAWVPGEKTQVLAISP